MNGTLVARVRKICASLPMTLAALICGGCALGFMSLYFATGKYALGLFSYYLSQPMVLIVNLLPYVLMCLMLYGIINRAWIAFSVTGVLCLVFSWAQYWKLMARNDPIFAEDLTIVSEAMQMSGQYIQITWQIAVSAVLVILGAVALALLFRGRLERTALRAAVPVAVIALCCWLYPGVYASSEVYNSMKVWPEINPWFETSKYISRGGIYPFIHSIQSAVPEAPDGYSAEEAEQILAGYDTDEIPEEKKVSVIMVMYEAFSDLSGYTDRITGADPYALFHALQAQSYHGNLVTNIFAGGTIDTERCVLTGYGQLTNFRRTGWSYARYFAEQGYTVNGAHAGYEAFYNRRNVNENLGIADYRFIEGHYEKQFSGIPKDAKFLPDVTQYCKSRMENGPVFSFNVTYQNHGPYDTQKARFDKEYVPRGEMSEYDYMIVNNYLYGIEDTTRRMMDMVDEFRDSEEPVILVFFGDHKPWLGDQNSTYSALGIDITSNGEDSFYNYYSTEYTIWGNDAASEALGVDFSGTGPTISPCYLMNVLFELCGWEGPSYQKLTDEVMAALPIVHTADRYQYNGALVDGAQLPARAAELLRKMQYAQYYLAQDSAGRLPE